MLHDFVQPSSRIAEFEQLGAISRCAPLQNNPHRCFLQYVGITSPVARVAAFVTALRWQGRRVGLLGLYAAADDTPHALTTPMLRAAMAWLASQGCEVALGPVNGSTWYDYRFALQQGRPFLADVGQPDAWPVQWRAAGFSEAERYVTYAFDRDRFSETSTSAYGRRQATRGVVIESVSANNFDEVLPEIHALCLESFVDNPLFQPIGFDEFLGLYAAARQIVDPRYTLIARGRNGRLLGFALAFLNLLDANAESLVIKTVATRRAASATGIGAWLTHQVHRRAADEGMQRIYHALMHERNPSTRVLADRATLHRRYLLMGQSL